MILILAGILSLAAAFWWNRFLLFLSLPEKIRLGIIIPVGEELIKIAVAMLFQLEPIFVYALFGLGEGILEAVHLKKHLRPPVILMGIGTHLVLGTFFLLKTSLAVQSALAVTAHVGWNQLVILKTLSNKS